MWLIFESLPSAPLHPSRHASSTCSTSYLPPPRSRMASTSNRYVSPAPAVPQPPEHGNPAQDVALEGADGFHRAAARVRPPGLHLHERDQVSSPCDEVEIVAAEPEPMGLDVPAAGGEDRRWPRARRARPRRCRWSPHCLIGTKLRRDRMGGRYVGTAGGWAPNQRGRGRISGWRCGAPSPRGGPAVHSPAPCDEATILLSELASAVALPVHGADVEVDRNRGGLARRSAPGDLFVVQRGAKADGSAFVPEARERGAVAACAAIGIPGFPTVVASDPARRRPASGRRPVRSSRRASSTRRHHRHARQDLDRAAGAVGARGQPASRVGVIGSLGVRHPGSRGRYRHDDAGRTGDPSRAPADGGRGRDDRGASR